MDHSYSKVSEDVHLVRSSSDLSEASSEAGTGDVEKYFLETTRPKSRASRWSKILLIINIVVLTVSVGVGSWSYSSLMSLEHNVNNALFKKTSFYCMRTRPYNIS